MENGDIQKQQRERVDHERRRLAESRRRKEEEEHKQRFTKEDSKRKFREQRIRRRNDSGGRGYIRVPGNKLPHPSFPRTLDGRSGCANSTIRKSARPEDKDQKHHLQDCDPCPEQRNLSSTEGNSVIEQQTRTFCSSRGNNEDLLWDCSTRTSDGSSKPSQDHHRSNRCNSDDSVGCIHQAGIANKEHQSQMGRLCPSTIYSSRPSRLLHSKTIYSGSGEVLQMPKIRAHNKNMSSNAVNVRNLQWEPQNNCMSREERNRTCDNQMQQLQRTARIGLKSMSCKNPESTSDTEVTNSQTSNSKNNPGIQQTSTTNIQSNHQGICTNNGGLSSCANSYPRKTNSSKGKQQNHQQNTNSKKGRRMQASVVCRSNQAPVKEICSSTTQKSSGHASQDSSISAARQTSNPGNNREYNPTEPQKARSTRYVRANSGHAHSTTATTKTSSGSTRQRSKDYHQINDNIRPKTNDTTCGAGLDQAFPEAATQINDSQDVNLSTGMAKALNGMDMPRELKIVHWNAQGANRKRALITSCIINEGIDIMLIQDTRLKKRQDGRVPIRVPGCHTFYKPLDENCHGLLTIVRKNIPVQLQKTTNPGENTEILTVKIWLQDEALLIHNMYRVKNTIDLIKLLNNPIPAFIGCDINAHHLLWDTKSDAAGRAIMNQLEQLDDYVILNEDQQATTTYDTAIDVTIVHSRFAARSKWEVMSSLVSDHLGICTMLYTQDLPPEQHHPQWILHKADWSAFKQKISTLLADTELALDVNEMAQKLTDILTQAANESIPKSSCNAKKRMYWCHDPIVQTAKRMYNRSIRRYKKQKSDANKQNMQESGDTYAHACNTAKNAHWNKWVTESNDCISPKQLWRKIKRATGTDQMSPRHQDPAAESNKILSGFVERASSAQLPHGPPDFDHAKILNAKGQQSRADRPITANEIRYALKRAKHSAPGEDAISYEMMKQVPEAYIETLAELYSISLRMGKLPRTWKEAKIIPIPKKDKDTYRPISLLPVQGKLMEKIMLQRIRWIASPHNARSLGFKPASGTRDAIATLVHDLSTAKTSRRKKAAAVFLDLRQAFELVQKNAILSELVEAGVSGKVLSWCEDFLTNRQAHLLFQGTNSATMQFDNGTPQGSTLSPCFFNYAMNVFLKLRQPAGVKIITYADDIVLYCDYHSDPVKQLQTALNQMAHAADNAGFLFAPAKTKAMCFFEKDPATQLNINNQHIEWQPQYNYLGVIIDKQLLFTSMWNT